MAIKSEYEKAYDSFIVIGVIVLIANFYYYCHPLFAQFGLTGRVVDAMMLRLRHGGIFSTPYKTKLFALFCTVLTIVTRHGHGSKTAWWQVGIFVAVGLLFFLFPLSEPLLYLLSTTVGLVLTLIGVALAARNISGFKRARNDVNETFEQCEELIETEDSINLPTIFQYQYRKHNGWINVVAPNRATLVTGTPGSGKSASVFWPFIDQMLQKGYAMFVYDYKYPSLTDITYNMLLKHKDSYAERGIKVPQMCIINFGDPRYSMRCNPLNPKYLTDPADSQEIAQVIMKNLSKGSDHKNDYFDKSATNWIDTVIWFLRSYQDGRFCTFAHVIEMMTLDYKLLIEVMAQEPKLQAKIKPFKDALDEKVMEQLQGQLSSASIPLSTMSSPALYWVLSGDDFSLDMNNPDEPKIICMGNDPKRQRIYGTTLSLFISRMFSLVNDKHKRKCGVLLDELPTIFTNDLDNLIATARENKVSIILGAQDKSQLVRDYTEKEANVIFNTVGNIISGQVNGTTAEMYSKSFGREFRERQSQTTSDDSESIQVSFSQEDILPVSRIETLSQGRFFGKVADTYANPIPNKFFCGEIYVDIKAREKESKQFQPLPKITDFGEEELRERILNGDLREQALRAMAEDSLREVGCFSFSEENIEMEIAKFSEEQINTFLEDYAESYCDEHVKQVIEDNYMRIKREVQSILDSYKAPETNTNDTSNGQGGTNTNAPSNGQNGQGTDDEDITDYDDTGTDNDNEEEWS